MNPATHTPMTEKEVLAMFVKAAEKFIAKVESGNARSVVTYAEMKAALTAAKGL